MNFAGGVFVGIVLATILWPLVRYWLARRDWSEASRAATRGRPPTIGDEPLVLGTYTAPREHEPSPTQTTRGRLSNPDGNGSVSSAR